MAGPCVLYNGKKYTKGEFAALLHDGELSNLIGNSKLDATVLKGEIPAQFKVATPEPKKMSVITPEKSSNFANLTQDDEGNAVFFHVGDAGYETIKPSSGQSTRTSKGEAAAIGKVGGVAMYYTSPNDSETMVTGPGKYAVKVPIEKVYDFNTDENNYLEEAQKRHEAENPGKAMDANSELAYITKIAGENGYDMVVADWGGKTRAQTTKELTPTDTQVSNGAQVTKTFDEKYVPNTEKGFVPVVPESKDSKFQKIYDKIYKYRNSQQNYDALYKLSTSSLDREAITKLVNESDLPQDLKDEYNKIDKQKQGKRRSYMKTEEVSVEGAPEGNYLNVGMEIGKDGEMLTIEEIKEALPDDVEVSEELVKNVESEFNGEASVEPTTILKTSRPLTDDEMQNLLVATDQMGISQMVDGKGIVHGTEQWGKFNPKFFHMPDSRVLSDVVSKEKTIEQEVEEISNLFSTDINKAVENAKAALANLLPNVKFVIHDDYDSYTKAVGDEDVESGGTYVSKTNTIHINKRAATKTTVAHEVFHAVLLNMVGTDVKAADVTKRMINALSKQLDNNPDLKEYLENFVASYDENIKNEEKAAELFGYLAANYDTLPKQSQNLIKRWMDAIAKIFGFKPFTDNEVVDFFNTLSEKVATGQEITDLDVSKVIPSTTDVFGNLKKPSESSVENLKNKKQKIAGNVKSKVIEGKTVSTRLPKKNDVHSRKDYIVSMKSLEEEAAKDKRIQDQYIKIAKEISSYGISKIKKVENFEDAKKIVNDFKKSVKSNLKWLYNSFGKDVRDISKLWYDGANVISNNIASEYNYSLEQVAGVMAVLSPQMDWFRNLSLGRRVIDIYAKQQDSIFDPKMIEYINKATTGTGKNKVPLFKDAKEIISRVKGKKLSELNNKDKSYFIRVFDEVYNPREYDNISPNGETNGLVRKSDGSPGACGWGGFSTIEKSISILENGSIENISSNLGNMHKVRNFFNNISNPNDLDAVTIDTHAVAAGLLLPLSGSSKQVLYNFGGAGNVSTGMNGTYPLYADAYRELASELDLLPREVQSITWEAVRGLFKATFKSNKNNELKINKAWDDYSSGSITLNEAHSEIESIAGGISKPLWFEYIADENKVSMDKNSAAVDQSNLDNESEIQYEGTVKKPLKTSDRKQTSVISNKIKAAKQAGFSDAAISQYLQNNGYTAEQASKGLLDYNKKEIQKAQKEEGIFLEDTGSKFKNYIGKVRRRLLSSRGFKAKSQRLGIEEKIANVEYQLKMMSNVSKKFDRLLRRFQGDKEKLISDFDLYLRGDNSVNIPLEFKALANIARNQMDGLTDMLIRYQAIPAESVENIRANIGSYMNRAYEIFNNKDWSKKVKEEVVESAKDFFRTKLLIIASQNAMLSGRSVNDEVLNSLNEIQNKTKELDKLITEYNKSQSNQNQLVDKVKEISDLMTNYGFREGKEILDYVLSAGNNINTTKISDKIDSFFKRVSVIKNSATSSKNSGIDLKTQLERDIDNQIDRILNKDITNDFINSGNEGSKDLSVLKRRLDIPLEIRALMGEYTDPIQNYANTVSKLASLVYNAKYLTELKEKGLGTIFFEKEDVNRPQDFKYEIASNSTKTLNPLGGLYTSKELKEAFSKEGSKLERLGKAAAEFDIVNYYMNTLRYIKKAKTIQSIGTHMKNVLGAFEFALSNGHVDFKEYADAYKVVMNDIKNKGNKELEDKMLEYIKSGVITQNVALGEIKSMFKDDDFEKAFERRMNMPNESNVSKVLKGARSYFNKFDKKLIDVYQAEDNLFKIIGFEIERNRYADIDYDKKYDALTDDQKKEVDKKVSENIKNTLPNYDRIPEIGKFFKVIPIAATFISFELESIRTSYNTVSLAFSEMKSDNPKSKKLGATRFAALAATQGFRYFLKYMLGSAAFGWLRGLGDDEEEEANKRAKRFTPYYVKNSMISVVDMGKGKFSYIDLDASNPRSKVPKMLEAFTSGEDPSSMLINLVEESMSTFVSNDILLNKIGNLKNNEDDFGNPIFNKYDTPFNIGKDIINYSYDVFMPGTGTSIKKIYKSDSKVAAAVGQATGYRITDVEIEKQYYFKAKKTSEELRKANDIYDDAFYKFEKGEITEEERKEAYEQSNKSVKLVLGEANKDFNAAIFFGANPDALDETLSKVRLSEGDQIMSGEFEDIDSKIPLTKEEEMKEIERLKEKTKSRGIKNLDEIRRKAREKGGN